MLGCSLFCCTERSAVLPDVSCFLTFPVRPRVCPQIEKRMELVRLVSHNSHKRLASCLQGQLGTDAEKRHVRKWPICVIIEFLSAQGGFKPSWSQSRSG